MRKFFRQPRLNVYYKIILPFLIVIVLVILTTIPYGIKITNELNIDKADRSLSYVSEVVQNHINARMDDLLSFIQTVVDNDAVAAAMAAGNNHVLMQQLLPTKVKMGLDLMAVYQKQGRRILGLGDENVLAALDGMEAVSKAFAGIHIKSVDTTGPGILLLVAVPHEVFGQGINGILVAGILADEEFMGNIENLAGLPVAILSYDNRIIVSSRPRFAESILGQTGSFINSDFSYFDLQVSKEPFRAVVKDLLVYNFPAARLIVGSSLVDIISFRNKILNYILLMSFLGSITVIIIGIVLARNISNPLKKLLDVTEAVGGGNFEIRIDKFPNNEIGDLSRSFNNMVKNLAETVDELHQSRAKIAKYAHELEQYSTALQQDKKETEAILQNIRDGLVMIGRMGNIKALNSEAARIIGCGQNKCMGQNIQSALTPLLPRLANPGALLKMVQATITNAVYEESHEMVINHPQKVVYRIKTNPVFDEEKILIGWIFIFTNITTEKELEEMKNNFLATISHELRTPLTSIKGSLSLLLDGNLGHISQDQREFLKIASYNSERLTSLVNNILDLARIEAGHFWAKKIECDFLGLITKSLDGLKSLALSQNKKIGFKSSVKSAPIEADPERIVQLISNLVDNAIKFSPEASQITVRLEEFNLANPESDSSLSDLPDGVYYRFRVEDQGDGIPPDQIKLVFNKFYQADMSSTRKAGGSGLGLTIVKTIAAEHGGTVWAENLPDGGCSFSVMLPRASSSNLNIQKSRPG